MISSGIRIALLKFLSKHDLIQKPVPTFWDHAPGFYLSMIFPENRYPLFKIMLQSTMMSSGKVFTP
jgi:hypothetical protein